MNYIKVNLLVVFTILLLSFSKAIRAQNSEPLNTTAIGMQINQYHQDFGIGVNLTSPRFAHQRIAVRVRSNLMYQEHLQNQEATWTPYLNSTLGITGKTGTISNAIQLYGEGGVIGLFPSDDFSSESFEFGGYGLFGFEFYMNPDRNYFIEIGAVGTGASADKVTNEPIYSNGLTISTGFRLHL